MKIKMHFFIGLFFLAVLISSCHNQDLTEQKKLYSLIYEDEYQSCMNIIRDIEYRSHHDNLSSNGKMLHIDSLRLSFAHEYISNFDSSIQLSKVNKLVAKMENYFKERGHNSHSLRYHMNMLYSNLRSKEDSLIYLQLKIVLVKIFKMQLEEFSQEISGNYTQRWFSMMNYNNEIISEENCFVEDTVRILLFPSQNDLNGNWCKAYPINVSIKHKESNRSILPIDISTIKAGVFIKFSPTQSGNYEIIANVEYLWNTSFDYEDNFGRLLDFRGFKKSILFSKTIPVLAKGQKVIKKKIVVSNLID